jgi:putative transposase
MIKNRKLNRLKNYDYSKSGYYFVTICMKNFEHVFGEIKNGKIILNEYGEIVKNQWQWLEKQYEYIKLDVFIVMPNHIHGILIIENNAYESVGTSRDLSLQRQQQQNDIKKIKSLSELIGAFKTTSSKIIHQNGLYSFAWQRSFYDHIIRNEKALFYIRKYIQDNPIKWDIKK